MNTSSTTDQPSIAAVTGAAVAAAMNQAGLKFEELVEASGIDSGELVDGLSAQRSFTINALASIADALGVEVTSLLEPPTFTCPPWCVVSAETHLRQLFSNDGDKYTHDSADREIVNRSSIAGEPRQFWLSVYTDAEGRPAERPAEIAFSNDTVWHLEDAAAIRDALTEWLPLMQD